MPVLSVAHREELVARLLHATRGIAYVAQLDRETGRLSDLAIAECARAQELLPLAPGSSFGAALEAAIPPEDQQARLRAFQSGRREVQTRVRCTDQEGTTHWLHEEAIVEGTHVVGVLSVLPTVPPTIEPLVRPEPEPAAPRPRSLRTLAKPTTSGELERALDEKQFTLAYQFQLRPAERMLVGAEVFVRWRHPSQGLLFPGRFLQKAEESGLIIPLGTWVIEAAFAQQQAWLQRGYSIPLSINLAVNQVTSPHFAEQLPAAPLSLELPESALALHGKALVPHLTALKERDFTLGLDNAGLTPLPESLLEQLPLSYVKLSRTIVQDLDSPENQQRAEALAAQAREHNLQLVADGVETSAQATWLQERGYPVLQGYLYSRPLAAEALEEIIRSGSYQLP
ncbi:EAL domain-containing protein [Armatimonas rosea]|uniref:EAL domain-containing protein (Putative c-di-GMP-specific phosphodiesterase class I) n=1 Tax=Armatimonas rosea TaxID=685828 RepID=A0A7W9SX47_ARMRO|nr:EAL domain-containing protein [Armatimonas rosea]MBB6053489.1 EAL domain-containing protein (putative c-di-GMP-specific phosphodiesterase class I) [Armatimonas rosea]